MAPTKTVRRCRYHYFARTIIGRMSLNSSDLPRSCHLPWPLQGVAPLMPKAPRRSMVSVRPNPLALRLRRNSPELPRASYF